MPCYWGGGNRRGYFVRLSMPSWVFNDTLFCWEGAKRMGNFARLPCLPESPLPCHSITPRNRTAFTRTRVQTLLPDSECNNPLARLKTKSHLRCWTSCSSQWPGRCSVLQRTSHWRRTGLPSWTEPASQWPKLVKRRTKTRYSLPKSIFTSKFDITSERQANLFQQNFTLFYFVLRWKKVPG